MSRASYADTPPLRWTGGKWKIADWITSYMPPHDLYCEPYCGSAAVFFRKWPSRIEVLNDRSGDLVNFFTMLRERPDELIAAIELTPYARDEYTLSYEPATDPLERARRFYVQTRQAFGGFAGSKTGWRTQRNRHRGTSITEEWRRLDGLWMAVERLKDAQIENDDALAVIERYDNPRALFYVDPPYVLSSRSQGRKRKRYEHEMSDDDHRALADCLHQVKGAVLLSGYPSPLYDELYPGWLQVKKSATTNGNSSAIESLWLNPLASSARPMLLDVRLSD